MLRLFETMRRHAVEAPRNVAVTDSHGSITRNDLLSRAQGLASELVEQPKTIGILAPNGIEWVVAQLACAFAGKITVPLPSFFSSAQIGHVVRNASIGSILTTNEMAPLASVSGVPTSLINHSSPMDSFQPLPGFGQIIYTSGSTGQPKGVRHETGQIAWSATALAAATGATANDTYLSVLPLPLLLETICSIFIPAMLGAYVHFDSDFADQVARGSARGISGVFEANQPTTTVVVPQLLKQWVGELRLGAKRAPSSLRFVAVGGAPVPTRVAETAWELGIPVHEGYGLSECCSVVSLNRPGERRADTVGRPLEGSLILAARGGFLLAMTAVTAGRRPPRNTASSLQGGRRSSGP